MKFRDLFYNVSNKVKKKEDEDAFKLVIDNYDEISYEEVQNFFLKNENIYLISGSGGSGINKPNITSILTIHLSLINKIYFCDRQVEIYKTGSRKKSSLQGSTDYFESLGFVDVKYKDDEIFNKVMNIIKIIPSVKKYCDIHNISSVPYKKKILFTKNICECQEILNKVEDNQEILLINGKLNGKSIDEIIPSNYYLHLKDISINKKVKNDKLFVEIDKENIDIYNDCLLVGYLNNFWGNCLKFELIESISFFFNKTYLSSIKIVEEYIKNRKIIIYFDQDINIIRERFINEDVKLDGIVFTNNSIEIKNILNQFKNVAIIGIARNKKNFLHRTLTYKHDYSDQLDYLLKLINMGGN